MNSLKEKKKQFLNVQLIQISLIKQISVSKRINYKGSCERVVKNLVKKSFMRKEKKTINILIVFFISYKSDVKTFFN